MTVKEHVAHNLSNRTDGAITWLFLLLALFCVYMALLNHDRGLRIAALVWMFAP